MVNLLGIDLGTSSVKVVVTDQNGTILSRGSAEYAMLTPQTSWVEQAPKDWWQACLQAVRQAASALDEDMKLEGVGICGQMHGSVLLDGADHLLHPAVIWPDRRSTRQVEEITDRIGRERLIQITGSVIATGFQAATLRWFQKNQEDVWSRTKRVMSPKDYLRWRLTGEFLTDASDAAGTGLLECSSRNWSMDLLAALEIDPDLLPPIKESTGLAGGLLPKAAQDMGLPSGIPVVIGAADTAASLFGAGVFADGDLLLTISTGGQLITPTGDFIVDRIGRLHTFCSAAGPGQRLAGWYRMGATLSAGLSLRWLRDNILRIRSDQAYDQMIAWAEGAPPGSDGLIFIPNLLGERSPEMDAQTGGVFAGLTTRHGRGELVRAVMEGVVYSLYDKYILLVEDGLQAGHFVVAGGGARSRLWVQIAADVFGLPVETVTIEEQSAYGAALLAGAGIGLFNLAEGVQKWAKYKLQLRPDMESHAKYQDFMRFIRDIHNNTQHLSGGIDPDY